jgi:hypothetical protein
MVYTSEQHFTINILIMVDFSPAGSRRTATLRPHTTHRRSLSYYGSVVVVHLRNPLAHSEQRFGRARYQRRHAVYRGLHWHASQGSSGGPRGAFPAAKRSRSDRLRRVDHTGQQSRDRLTVVQRVAAHRPRA